MIDKIDYIVPYVNMADPLWKSEALKYTSLENLAGPRFRGDPLLLKYHFRSVAKSMPWINKVYLIVLQDSQIPSWINRKTVNIIYQKDFTPAEFFPTFSSTSIESFFVNIDKLEDKFIYGNDDYFYIGYRDKSCYYEKDKIKAKLIILPVLKNINLDFSSICNNSYKLAYNKDFLNKDFYIQPQHIEICYFKDIISKAYFEHQQGILKSISRFRDKQNISHFFYIHYANKNHRLKNTESVKAVYINTSADSQTVRDNFSIGTEPSTFIYNDDQTDINLSGYFELVRLLKSSFPSKCKYEN